MKRYYIDIAATPTAKLYILNENEEIPATASKYTEEVTKEEAEAFAGLCWDIPNA